MIDNDKFEARACDIDSMIHNKLGDWSDFLPVTIPKLPSFQRFQEHLMYAIMSFLNEENNSGSPQELFIQIPVEDFANIDKKGRDNLQKETFQKATGTVATCLSLATIDSILDKSELPEERIRNIDKWDREEGTTIFIDDETEQQIITWTEKKTRLLPRLSSKDSLYTSRKEKLPPGWYFKSAKNTSKTFPIRKLCQVPRAFILNECGRYNQKDVQIVVDIIKSMGIKKGIARQYDSAALIHIGKYPPINENIPINSRYINTIKTYNSIYNLQETLGIRETVDLIVAIGDKRYVGMPNTFRDCTSRKGKIIYIGSELPEEKSNILTYSMSYREIYRYCSYGGTNCKYVEPFKHIIDFPWLNATKESLENLLDELSIHDEVIDEIRQSLINYICSIFSNIDFSNSKWEEKKENVCNYLSENILYDCQEESRYTIICWIRNLRYSESLNPKLAFIRSMRPKANAILGKYEKAIIFNPTIPNSSQGSTYKDTINELHGYGNYIVIDCASYGRKGNHARFRAYPYLLSHHLFANVVALYYSIEKAFANGLFGFVNKELSCYKGEVRKQLETDYLEEDIMLSQDGESYDFEEDYADFLLSIDKEAVTWSGDNKQIIVHFADGSRATNIGDVLVVLPNGDLERRNISDFEDYEEEDFLEQTTNIIYYRYPENFSQIKEASNTVLYDFIGTQEKLWKLKFREYVSEYGGNTQEIIARIGRAIGVKRDKLKRYIDERCSTHFSQDTDKICNFLVQHQKISEDDAKRIRFARKKYHSTSQQIGDTLKDEVLMVREGKQDQLVLLPKVADRISTSIQELAEQCLMSATISKIEVKNN